MLLAVLKLVRVPNLAMILLTQVLIKYGLLDSFGISITLSGLGFSLLAIATICIAAAGNIINDIHDLETDSINKPEKVLVGTKIPFNLAYILYILLSIVGVGIGFFISNLIGKPGFSSIFITISALLYLYATYLKHIIIVGNLAISMLVAFSIIIVGLYDLLPVITPENQQTQSIIFSIILDYSLFALLLNWLREMVKDQEDIKGDYNAGRNTLPIAIGEKRTNLVIFLIGLLPLIAVVYYLYNYLFENLWAVLYALFLIVAPLLYFMIHIWTAENKRDYTKLSLLLKIIMLLGIISLGLYKFILR
ncbi:4-hydroxybenzoate polyprenyltransferase [Gillisia sp. Hel_I_86]|uniref:geranylgeranylglycerol-phosphate geranylgeranyltransferase n=1 Tax=Gillisia sp. Hel_I_86 TaxID=1249981 RepID=UPI001199B3BA|nr:geranylgeranylglycerol-phosphate geranylgeranyltransferase [Gillisia sp. Hel_I_86]TVZ27769.1 4-hydroxybenzoate polyprenyltransferase [Gillisia sp. Hel_I_86]